MSSMVDRQGSWGSRPAINGSQGAQTSPARRRCHPGSATGSTSTGLLIGAVVVGLLLSIMIPSVWYLKNRSSATQPGVEAGTAPLPVMFQLPGFSLTERSGEPVTLETLAGRVWIADFIFTTCGGPCPMMTQKMALLQADLADVADLRLVTITVDPKTDTPQRLQAYAKAYRAHPERWLFLTGQREAIHELSTRGFRLAAIVDDANVADPDHPILHSTRFVLVDRAGRVRGYYDGTSDESVEQLKADARRLATEAQGSG